MPHIAMRQGAPAMVHFTFSCGGFAARGLLLSFSTDGAKLWSWDLYLGRGRRRRSSYSGCDWRQCTVANCVRGKVWFCIRWVER